MKNFTFEERIDMANRLEKYDAVFTQFWQVGKPMYDDSIPTAAVSFDATGQVVQLHVNPKFWSKQTPTQQDFIMCHEMLHVILEHGRRAKDAAVANQHANNVAMDVVVNELLVSGFGFDRKQADPKNRLCWLNTIFPKPSGNMPVTAIVQPNQTFEYYLNQFPKQYRGGGSGKGKGGQVLDDHSKLAGGDAETLAEKIGSRLSPDERKELGEKLGKEGQASGGDPDDGPYAGTGAGGFVRRMQSLGSVKKKRKWESLIKRCLREIAGDGLVESWMQHNRRLAAVEGSDVILPCEVESDGVEKRAKVYMFLDTSGSCSHLAKRFWKLAASVPKDVFDLRLRCFDTKVYEIDFKTRKLYGFGGTSFSILEKHIQDEKKNGNYPDGVFVITDGEGNYVSPEHAERWHVLLTTGYRNCFPADVNCYSLRQFE